MTVFNYTMEDVSAQQASIGLVVLQSDETIERDFRRMLPAKGAALYVTRIESDADVTSETLSRMASRIESAARMLPRPIHFDAVGYGCTSGTSVIGVAEVARQLEAGCTASATSEPVSALLAAGRALGLSRLAFLSPYVAEVSSHLRNVLAKGGLESPVFGTFNEALEENVARIDAASILSAVKSLTANAEVDGVFLSCTNLRTLDVLDAIEAETGLPALSSNQVLCWHLMRLSGMEEKRSGLGRLFAEC